MSTQLTQIGMDGIKGLGEELGCIPSKGNGVSFQGSDQFRCSSGLVMNTGPDVVVFRVQYLTDSIHDVLKDNMLQCKKISQTFFDYINSLSLSLTPVHVPKFPFDCCIKYGPTIVNIHCNICPYALSGMNIPSSPFGLSAPCAECISCPTTLNFHYSYDHSIPNVPLFPKFP